MKRLIPYLIMVALGVATSVAMGNAILGRSVQGIVATVNELRIYPQSFDSFSDNTPEVWSIATNSALGDPVSTNFYPSFQSSSLYPEPGGGTQGRAFEFVTNGYYPDGGFTTNPWVNPQNLQLAVLNNGGTVGQGFGVTIDGDIAGLSSFPETNMKLMDDFHNLTPVNGVFDHQIVIGNGSGHQTLMILEISYDFSVDGTGGGDFILNVTDAFAGTASVFIPCQLGVTNTVVTQAMFGGSVIHFPSVSQEFSFSALGSCTTPPTFGSLRVYHVFTTAP